MRKKFDFLLAAGVACLLASFALLFVLNLPTVRENAFSFPSAYGDKPVTLKASYWANENADYAVLICPGYSCDRQKWRPFADLFAANGYAVMSFDYSGQGASGGVIGFDNAKTDSIPAEIADAIEVLHQRSGIGYENIILVGHSMGGRSILRLLDDYNNPAAITAVQKRPIGNVILLSPEVNYNFNAQASLFAGTSDDAEEPWHSYSAASIAGTNVYLFGSTADDIVSDEDVLDIYAHMGGADVPESGMWNAVQTTEYGSKITVNITNGVLHSYQMYSPKFAAMANDALAEISGHASTYPAGRFRFVYGGWALGLMGLLLTLLALNRGCRWVVRDEIPVLEYPARYLRRKALLWLPGTVVAFLLCCVTVVMPFGSPVMNTPYMCFIAGYGITMLFAYRKGRFPGTRGSLPELRFGIVRNSRQAAKSLLIAAALCAFVWYALRATMYRLIPLNFRLFWVLFATAIMSIGYYVSGCENDMLDAADVGLGVRLVYNLIQYVPLLLLVLFYLALGSYSGMIGQAQNMLLMYIFCIPLGDYLKKMTGSRLLGALITAFLFQTLMITSAALISMF